MGEQIDFHTYLQDIEYPTELDPQFYDFGNWRKGIFYVAPQDMRIVVKERYRGTGIIPFVCTFNLANGYGKWIFGMIITFEWGILIGLYILFLFLSLD